MNYTIKTGYEEEAQKVIEMNSHDDYGKVIVDFVIEWMEIAEKMINKGVPAEDAVGKSLDKTDGYSAQSGFSFSCARAFMKEFWKYGYVFGIDEEN